MNAVAECPRPTPGRAPRTPDPLRVALVADLEEERWISMDMAADVLRVRFGSGPLADIDATRLRPPMRRRLTRLPALGMARKADTADRVINRFWDYPRWLRRHADMFDLFHVVDHTYAHLALDLPGGRTVVTVHDVDTFLPLVDPARTRSTLPRSLAARIRRGLQRAVRVLCVSESTRVELDRYGLVPHQRSLVIHNGVDPVYTPQADAESDAAASALLGPPSGDVVELVHCGTTIGRKRIDTLLEVFAVIRARNPCVRLIKAGGALTDEQAALARRLHVDDAIVTLPFLPPKTLAAVYRRARVALTTSDREGFCLPLIEALACGTAVVASDLPVLREVGGNACSYAPVGDIERWALAVSLAAGQSQTESAASQARVQRAAAFSWDRHAASVATVYREVARAAEAAAPAHAAS